MSLLLVVTVVGVLGSALGGGGPAADARGAGPQLLGCHAALPDRLLPTAAFSALLGDSSGGSIGTHQADGSGDAACLELCSRQAALLAATNVRWCFCLNQPAAAQQLTADCAAAAPPGLELLRVFSLPRAPAPAGRPGLRLGDVELTYQRCAASAGAVPTDVMLLDECVHTCAAGESSFLALGPAGPGADGSGYYRCGCGAADGFGASLPDGACSRHCLRHGEPLATTCGGTTAFSVHRLHRSGPASTTAPQPTVASSAAASCRPSADCPAGGIQVTVNGSPFPSCYLALQVDASGPVTLEAASQMCAQNAQDGENWRVWATEHEDELKAIYEQFVPGCLADAMRLVTSGKIIDTHLAAHGFKAQWWGWPTDVEDWLKQRVQGSVRTNDSIVLESLHDGTYDKIKFKTYDSEDLPKNIYTICEHRLKPDTSTTENPSTTTDLTSTSSPTTSPTTATSTSVPPTSTSSLSTSTPSSISTTHVPIPDDDINDLIDKMNKSSNITSDDVIHVVDQLDDLIQKQRNKTKDMTPEDRLESDTKFTVDLVQLADTVLAATDAWKNMTREEQLENSKTLMTKMEEAAFGLANSTVDANSGAITETVHPSIVMSASSVDKNFNGSFIFPRVPDAPCHIMLPVGYTRQAGCPGKRLPQVGLLYRSEVMSLILPPANNSKGDSGKRLNSPVLSFSLGWEGRPVQFQPGSRAQMKLRYRRPEKMPDHKDVWRDLHPGEQPSAVVGTAVCAFWNETVLEWQTDGCYMQEASSSKEHAICSCSHLTNFAVLMDYHEYVGTPLALSVLTWILGSISFICLVLTWIVFTFNSLPADVPAAVRSLRCSRTTITRHLSAVYAAGLLLLLTVMDRRLVALPPAACTAAGIAIHYCFLAVFAWSLVEGLHLYKVLRHVFEPKSNSMVRYYMYGYLCPAIIVIATNATAVATGEYAYVRDEFCWLTTPYFIWFFNGPVAFVLIMNLYVIILAFRSAAMLKVNQLRAKKEKVKRWLKGWFSLSCMLGIQWSIGYIYVDGSNVFDYVFTIMNCSQGILLFVFHCVLRTRTRQILLGRISEKRSTMMNSVYGQMVIAEQKKRAFRQSQMSHDTSVTTLSTPSPPTSDSADSSPGSQRSTSSSESWCQRQARKSSRHRQGRQSGTRTSPTDGLKGAVNPAFLPDEPWAPLPDITEESEHTRSPRHEARTGQRSSRTSRPPPVLHTDSVEIMRGHGGQASKHSKRH